VTSLGVISQLLVKCAADCCVVVRVPLLLCIEIKAVISIAGT
jgi:hypothetical protein